MTEEMKNLQEEAIEELEDVYVTLEFEDGDPEEVKLIAVFEMDDKLYAALDPEDGTNELYFFEYMEVGEDAFQLADIEDEETFKEVTDFFFEILDENQEG